MKSKDYYDWYKNAGICPRCGTRPIAKARSACLDCLDKDADRARTRREKLSEEERRKQNNRDSIRHAAWYRKRKESGLCVQCGKMPPAVDRVRCGKCLAKMQAAAEKKRRKHGQLPAQVRWESGCWCGRPSLPGMRVCKDCHNKLSEMGEKGRRTQSETGYRWDRIGYGIMERQQEV